MMSSLSRSIHIDKNGSEGFATISKLHAGFSATLAEPIAID